MESQWKALVVRLLVKAKKLQGTPKTVELNNFYPPSEYIENLPRIRRQGINFEQRANWK